MSSMSHLLDPLRELSIELDLGRELEEYLQHIQVDESVLVNFAQAALLVQQSSTLYSKKVENLYALVLETVAHLQSTDVRDPSTLQQQQGRDGRSKRQKNNQGKATTTSRGDTTLTVADMTAEANEINWTVRTHIEESHKIDLPPRDSRRNNGKTNTKTFQASMLLMGSFVSMDNDSGESLKLKSCLIDPETGALFLDESSKSLLGEPLIDPQPSFTSFPALESTTLPSIPEPPQNPTRESNADYHYNDDNDNYVDFGGGHSDDVMEPVTFVEATATEPTPVPVVWRPKDEETDPDDPWALLDAYETKDCVIKPFNKGVSYRTRVPKTIKKRVVKVEPIYTPVHPQPKKLQRLRHQFLAKPCKLFIETPFSSLRDLYNQCMATTRATPAFINRKKAAEGASIPSTSVVGMQQEVYGAQDDDNYGGFADAGDDFGMGGDDFDQDDDDDEANGAQDDIPTVKKAPRKDSDDETTEQPPPEDLISITKTLDWNIKEEATYEDLCKQHIEQFMRGTEQYLRESNVNKSVTEWQTKLAPLLEDQSRRPPFDVKECSVEIAKKLETMKPTHVGFDQVMEDMASYEICRMFSAVLHMANDGDVELGHDNSMDSLTMRRVDRI
ncbi:unnamed protein product [Aphanomyces euteiches]|nr:hypothetical protein AeRB84_004723 [Aphanomyces euteiches]